MKKIIDKYTYQVRWSEEDQIHICRCLEFSGLQAHGASSEGAIRECKLAVEAALDLLTEQGQTIPEPMSIKKYPKSFPLRLPSDLRLKLELQAAEEGTSLNKLIEVRLSKSS